MNETAHIIDLLNLAEQGDVQAVGTLFAEHRERLRRMVEIRMDPRLQGRLDASDVLQDAYVEFARSLPEYLKHPLIPVFLWMRHITGRKLQALHRHHFGVRMRSIGKEIKIHKPSMPQASSVSLAAQLLGRFSTPSRALQRVEMQQRIQEALNSMEEIDREVLALRHFEQLTNAEVAQVLNISQAGASNRYVRALKRMKDALSSIPGFLESN